MSDVPPVNTIRIDVFINKHYLAGFCQGLDVSVPEVRRFIEQRLNQQMPRVVSKLKNYTVQWGLTFSQWLESSPNLAVSWRAAQIRDGKSEYVWFPQQTSDLSKFIYVSRLLEIASHQNLFGEFKLGLPCDGKGG